VKDSVPNIQSGRTTLPTPVVTIRNSGFYGNRGNGASEAGPQAVPVLLDAVVDEAIAAEGRFDAVGGRGREIVAVEQIVVGTALTGVHGRLARPEKEAVTAVGDRVVGNHVATALLVYQEAGGVLAAVVEAVAVTADAPVDPVVHHFAVGDAIQADAEARQEREVVVPDGEIPGTGDHQPVLALTREIAIDPATVDVRQVEAGAVAQPLVLLVMVIRHPVERAAWPWATRLSFSTRL